MNFNIAIIDDEPAARGVIRNILSENCPLAVVVGEAEGVAEGLAMLQRERPDILFLDVEMDDGTGFDLLDQISPLEFNVIFTTAYDDFAIKAFRYNAIDYLLKPVHPDELIAAVQKAQQNTNYQLIQRQIDNLINANSEKSLHRIVLPTGDGLVFIQTKDILRIESLGNFAYVYLVNGDRILASRNLHDFEEMLPVPAFSRPHQSHIINTTFVKKFFKDDGGYALLTNGVKIPVSRRNKDKFLEALRG